MEQRRGPRGRSGPKTIRVAVVGARQIMAAGLTDILRAESDIEVVARLPTLAAAASVLNGLDSHVVVVDVPVAAASASVAILRLRAAAPGRAIVIVGRKDDANIVKAVEVGAAAYVDEDATRAHLLAAVRGAARGQRPIRDDMVGREDLIERLLEDVQDRILGERAPSHPLTPRELHVLALVGRGMRNRDIAVELGLSEQTVKNHLHGGDAQARRPQPQARSRIRPPPGLVQRAERRGAGDIGCAREGQGRLRRSSGSRTASAGGGSIGRICLEGSNRAGGRGSRDRQSRPRDAGHQIVGRQAGR